MFKAVTKLRILYIISIIMIFLFFNFCSDTSTDSIEVITLFPTQIELAEPTIENGNVQLEWTHSNDASFNKYEICRSTDSSNVQQGDLIATLTDPELKSFTDSLPPLVKNLYYQIFVTNVNLYSRGSNIENVKNPAGPILEFVPYDALIHPNQPILYLLNRDVSEIIIINYSEMEVVLEKRFNGNIGYMDIGDNGDGIELYLPNSDGWVYIYDPENLNQVGSIKTGRGNTCVVTDERGHLFVTGNQPGIQTFNRSNGLLIDTGGFIDDSERLRLIRATFDIIAITTNVYPIDMNYYRFDENASFIEYFDDSQHGSYPLDSRIYRVSLNSEFVLTSSSGAAYKADNTMEYLGQIQRGSLYFSDYAFSDDGNTIYAATSNFNSIQVANYPDLTRSNQIFTRGFPLFVFKRLNQIVCISRIKEKSNSIVFEVLTLNYFV